MDKVNKYFPDLDAKQKQRKFGFKLMELLDAKQMQQYELLNELYLDWNSKINVISHKDIVNLYEHHVLHSLAIAKLIYFKTGTSIMDVGTGGGFPGIPLAILFPEVNFYLVDSIGKKIKVVNEVSKALNLKNVKAEQIRAEMVTGKFDFIITRAVSDILTLHNWVANKISKKSFNSLPNGMICMKGGDITSEIKPFKNRTSVYNIEDYFTEEYFKDKKLVYINLKTI